MDRSARIFLSYLDRFDRCLRNGKGSPTWYTSYSYMRLLNIPIVMKTYGSLPDLWEGGFIGECIIKRVRPHVHQVTKNWHVRLIEFFN